MHQFIHRLTASLFLWRFWKWVEGYISFQKWKNLNLKMVLEGLNKTTEFLLRSRNTKVVICLYFRSRNTPSQWYDWAIQYSFNHLLWHISGLVIVVVTSNSSDTQCMFERRRYKSPEVTNLNPWPMFGEFSAYCRGWNAPLAWNINL